MKKILISMITFTIVIGIVALSINTAFGNQTITLIEKIRYQTGNTHFYYYRFTWWEYMTNLNLTTTDTSILRFEMPTREWQEIQGNIFQDIWWQYLGNDLAVILNYIILAINILLYPLKLGAYLLRNVIALLGINQDTDNPNNGLSWLVIFVRDILSNIVIPYV